MKKSFQMYNFLTLPQQNFYIVIVFIALIWYIILEINIRFSNKIS